MLLNHCDWNENLTAKKKCDSDSQNINWFVTGFFHIDSIYITINKRTVTMFCLLTKFVWGREKNWPENQNTAIMNHMSNETDEHWFIWLRWWLSFHVIHLNFSWVITFCHEIDYFGMYIISHRSFIITSCLGIFKLHANILLSLILCQAKIIRHAEKCRPNNPWYPFSSIYINITQTEFAMRLQLAQSYYNSNILVDLTTEHFLVCWYTKTVLIFWECSFQTRCDCFITNQLNKRHRINRNE